MVLDWLLGGRLHGDEIAESNDFVHAGCPWPIGKEHAEAGLVFTISCSLTSSPVHIYTHYC